MADRSCDLLILPRTWLTSVADCAADRPGVLGAWPSDAMAPLAPLLTWDYFVANYFAHVEQLRLTLVTALQL